MTLAVNVLCNGRSRAPAQPSLPGCERSPWPLTVKRCATRRPPRWPGLTARALLAALLLSPAVHADPAGTRIAYGETREAACDSARSSARAAAESAAADHPPGTASELEVGACSCDQPSAQEPWRCAVYWHVSFYGRG